MFGALLLFRDEFIHVVSISFTALILTELIMVALTIRTWHWLMVLAEFLSLAIYILSLIILKDFFGKRFFFLFWIMHPTTYKQFGVLSQKRTIKMVHNLLILTMFFSDPEFLQTSEFIWKTIVITAVSCIPLYIIKFLRKRFNPPSYQKLS